MIREFVFSDWARLDANEFSKATNTEFLRDDDWWKYTLDDGEIKAIICFREDKENNWAILLLLSNKFTNLDGKKIKRFMRHCMEKLGAKRVWTVSRKCELIKRWHKFLGMKIEKTVEHSGLQYDLWSKVWG